MLTRTLAAAAAVLAISGTAQAGSWFRIDSGPTTGASLGFADAYGVASEQGQVARPDDIDVDAHNPAWFKSHKSKIKPVAGGALDEVTFTAAKHSSFDGFSFQAKDIAAGQTIFVTVKPWGGKKQTLDFFVGDNTAATPRLGIVGDDADARIKWVRISTPDGFVKLKQEQFLTGSGRGNGPSFSGESIINGDGGPRGVPEPATWALLFAGFGVVGASLRARRRALAAT